MSTFEELGVPAVLAGAAHAMGWEGPTPIQSEAVPAGLAGRDIIARAQTGTGKTGAYALILLSRIEPRHRSPVALVITPTRELAVQVDGELRKLAKATGQVSVPVYGGAGIGMQADALRRGTDLIVGTPGRLRDMNERGLLDLSQVTEVVLDEADRMLDMGFEEDLDAILSQLPSERQTMMFSATMTDGVDRIAQERLHDPLEVDASVDAPVTGLTKQYYFMLQRDEKKDVLYQILNNGNPKAIVFCATKLMVEELYEEMKGDRRVGTLHGDMAQKMRERITQLFRENRVLVLLATDVAARGIDVADVDLVINYDAPTDPETYLHRIGRTGRAGKEGVAVTFVTSYSRRMVRQYEYETGTRLRKVLPDELEPIEAEHPVIETPRSVRRTGGRIPHNRSDYDRISRGEQAVKQAAGDVSAGRSVRRERAPERLPEFTVIEVGLGQSDGFNRTQIADFVKSHVALGEDVVGKVGLGKRSSFVEVRTAAADQVILDLNGCLHNDRPVEVKVAPEKKSYAERSSERRQSRERKERAE